MPFAIKQNGIVLGILTITFSALSAGFGLYLQGLCSNFVKDGQASFFQLSRITYPSLSVVFDLAISIKCFGVGVSYLIIMADLMPQIIASLGLEGFITTRVFWVLFPMYVLLYPVLICRHDIANAFIIGYLLGLSRFLNI